MIEEIFSLFLILCFLVFLGIFYVKISIPVSSAKKIDKHLADLKNKMENP